MADLYEAVRAASRGRICVPASLPSAPFAQADSSTQTVNGTTTFDLNGRTGSVYVLWITRLADGPGRDSGSCGSARA